MKRKAKLFLHNKLFANRYYITQILFNMHGKHYSIRLFLVLQLLFTLSSIRTFYEQYNNDLYRCIDMAIDFCSIWLYTSIQPRNKFLTIFSFLHQLIPTNHFICFFPIFSILHSAFLTIQHQEYVYSSHIITNAYLK